MATIKEITSYADWDAHMASLAPTTLLIISFHAPWAAPCAQMATVLSTLASEYPADGSTSWVSLNAEELSDISEKYDVTAVPFLVLSKNSKVLETVSGSSAVKVRNAIEAHAGKPGTTTTTTTTTTGANGASASVGDAPAETDPAKAKEELDKRLGELVKAAPVMLFMKGTPSGPQCGFSRQMVALLRENSVKYGFFNILADDEVRQGLKEFADWPTYPQLWIDGELVGGLDIVSLSVFCTTEFTTDSRVQVKEEMENNPDYLKPYSVKANGE
jgi:Grx4 family monothiol glutaredoxin